MAKGKSYTPNDMRSRHLNPKDAWGKRALDHNADIHNPNNEQFQKRLDNRSRQLNPEDELYEKSRGEEK